MSQNRLLAILLSVLAVLVLVVGGLSAVLLLSGGGDDGGDASASSGGGGTTTESGGGGGSDVAAAASGRISMTESIESAVEGAAHVQECGPETVEAKLALFRAIDATAPLHAELGRVERPWGRHRAQGLTRPGQCQRAVALVSDPP